MERSFARRIQGTSTSRATPPDTPSSSMRIGSRRSVKADDRHVWLCDLLFDALHAILGRDTPDFAVRSSACAVENV